MKTSYYGECGEIMEISTSEVKSPDVKEHSDVIIELDGLKRSKEGNMYILLPPYEARELGKALIATAEKAEKENFDILTKPQQ